MISAQDPGCCAVVNGHFLVKEEIAAQGTLDIGFQEFFRADLDILEQCQGQLSFQFLLVILDEIIIHGPERVAIFRGIGQVAAQVSLDTVCWHDIKDCTQFCRSEKSKDIMAGIIALLPSFRA